MSNEKRVDSYEDSEDLRALFICAVRYCLGRRTYMPGLVTEWIMGHCSGKLSDNDLSVMLDDINLQRRLGLGDSCDIRTWVKFEAWLNGQREQLRRRNDNP